LDLRGRKWLETGEDCKMRRFITYIDSDKIKEDETGGECSTVGRDEKSIQYFGWKT
jgi:hypothetical protein